MSELTGDWSPVNTEVLKLASRPIKIPKLHLVKHTTNVLEMDWHAADDGGRRITAYNLFWDGGLKDGPIN